MAVIYQLYQDNREKSLTRGKWYARAKVQQTFDLDKLVEHMSNHDCPFSPGTIHGVLKDAIRCIRELTLDGNQVKLDELAMFSIGLMTKPANSAKEFMASKNIVGYRLRARATGEFTKKELALAAKAREDNEYSVDKEDEGNDEHPEGRPDGLRTGHTQVNIYKVREPGDGRPRLLRVPCPVVSPRLLRPQGTEEHAHRHEAIAHEDEIIEGGK